MNSMNDVKFLVEQIEFMVEGEVLAHDILAQTVGESYEEIIKTKVWPPSGDHYIKHMYFQGMMVELLLSTKLLQMAPYHYCQDLVNSIKVIIRCNRRIRRMS